jgi:hypothetical protein
MPLSEVQNTVGEGRSEVHGTPKLATKKAASRASKPDIKAGPKAFHMTAPKLKAAKPAAGHNKDIAGKLCSVDPAETTTASGVPEPTPLKKGKPAKTAAGPPAGRRIKVQEHASDPLLIHSGSGGSPKTMLKASAGLVQTEELADIEPLTSSRPARETQAQKSARLTRGEPVCGIRCSSTAPMQNPPVCSGATNFQSSVPGSAG